MSGDSAVAHSIVQMRTSQRQLGGTTSHNDRVSIAMSTKILVDRTTSFTYETIRKIIGKRYRLRKSLELKPEIPIGTEFCVEHGLINHEGYVFAVMSCPDRRQHLTEYGEIYGKDWHSDWFDVLDFHEHFLPRGTL